MLLIYLDTNVYSRPFDNQTLPDNQTEANAFLEIIVEVKERRLALLGSDILAFEVKNILSPDKRAKVQDYLGLCAEYVDNSEKVLNLGKHIQNECHIHARDALHIASAILGGARYFLSCDKQIIRTNPDKCYRRIASLRNGTSIVAMNPRAFITQLKRGELL